MGGEREEARAGAPRERERRRRAGPAGSEEDPGVRAFSRPPIPSPTPPGLPSLLGPGPEPQTLRHNSLAGAGGEATATLSANFVAWRDVGFEAWPGGGGGER